MLKTLGNYLHKTIVFSMAFIAVVFLFVPMVALLSQEDVGTPVPADPDNVQSIRKDLKISFVGLPRVATGTIDLKVAANKALAGLDLNISGPAQASFYTQRIKENNSYFYYYDWDTSGYPDGDYMIEARARTEGSPAIVGSFRLAKVLASSSPIRASSTSMMPLIPAGTDLSASSTIAISTSAVDIPIGLSVKFLDKPSTAKDTMHIYAFVNREPDSVVCLLDDKPHTSIMSTKISANRYGCRWETEYISDGEYKVAIRAQKGLVQAEDYQIISVSNNPLYSEASAEEDLDFIINIEQIDPVISGKKTIKAWSSMKLDAMEFRLSGESEHALESRSAGTNAYRADIDTKYLPNGVYTIQAWGRKDLKEATAELQVIVDNKAAQDTSSSTQVMYNGVVQEVGMDWGDSVPIVRFLDPPKAVKKTTQLKVRIYPRAESVRFRIEGAQPAEYDADEISTSTYAINFKSTDFGDGNYKVTALARNGLKDSLSSINFEIDNYSIDNEKAGIAIVTPKTGSNLAGLVDIAVKTAGPIIRVGVVQTSGFSLKTTKFKLNSYTYKWEARWDTRNSRNNIYEIKAFGYDQKGKKYSSDKVIVFVSNKQAQAAAAPKPQIKPAQAPPVPIKDTPKVSGVKISDKIPTSTKETAGPAAAKTIQASSTPKDTKQTAILASEKPAAGADKKHAALESSFNSHKEARILATAECKFNGLSGQDECSAFLEKQDLPWECKALSIAAKKDCDSYLLQKNALALCGTTSPKAVLGCDDKLFSRYGLPDICSGLDSKDCIQTMEDDMLNSLLFIPQSAINELRISKLTKDCKEAGAKNTNQCLAYLKKKYLPQECLDAGITNTSACQSKLAREYGAPGMCAGLGQDACRNVALRGMPTDIKTIIASWQIPKECRESGNNSIIDCEMTIRAKYITDECRSKNLNSKKECREYMTEQIDAPAKCSDLSIRECRALVDGVILSELVDPKVLAESESKIKKLIGTTLVIEYTEKNDMQIFSVDSGMKSKLTSGDVKALKQVFPLDSNNTVTGISFLPARSDIGQRNSVIGAVMVFDADGDGLTDEIEGRIASDPHKADSDGDGFDDYVEVGNGYNPTGKGKLTKQISAAETAFINKSALSQPKSSGETASDILAIESVGNLAVAINENKKHGEIRFQGRGVPNNVATLFIYSPMPIAITVNTDQNGNWSYDLDKSMADGAHVAYVAVLDSQGQVRSKSSAFPFYIRAAQAASADDYVQSLVNTPTNSVSGLLAWYLIAGSSFVIFILGIVFFYHFFSKETVKVEE